MPTWLPVGPYLASLVRSAKTEIAARSDRFHCERASTTMHQTEPPEDKDDLGLLPQDGLSESERLTRARFNPVDNGGSNSLSKRPRFSLAAMMVIFSFICIGLSGAHWPSALASLFAGLLGVLVLLGVLWPRNAFSNEFLSPVIWGGILIAYVLACVIAVMRLVVR